MPVTDTGLIRSSITLLVILVNPDRSCSLSANKPVPRPTNVTRAETFTGEENNLIPRQKCDAKEQSKDNRSAQTVHVTVVYMGLGCKTHQSNLDWLDQPLQLCNQSMDFVPGTATQFGICIDVFLTKGNELGTHWARVNTSVVRGKVCCMD